MAFYRLRFFYVYSAFKPPSGAPSGRFHETAWSGAHTAHSAAPIHLVQARAH